VAKRSRSEPMILMVSSLQFKIPLSARNRLSRTELCDA
jgi:hypothetical protein